MTEQKILYLMTGPHLDREDPLVELVVHMRDESLFYVNLDEFSWDSEDALKSVNSWLTEFPFGYGILVIEAPAEFRTKIMMMAESEDWKIVEFEIVLRKIKSGDGEDE